MKRLVLFLSLIALVGIAGAATSRIASGAGSATIMAPGDIKWAPMPGAPGVQMATLYGNPSKAGSEFAERYKVPAGFTFPVHYHPTDEEVTVLSGTFWFGVGDTIDPSKMVTLPAGSYFAIPKGVHHYGRAKTESILEVHGLGPDTLIPVKASAMTH